MKKSQLQRKKSEVCIRAKWLIRPGAYPSFCNMRLGAFLLHPLPQDEKLVHHGVNPSIKFVSYYLIYTWDGEKDCESKLLKLESGTLTIELPCLQPHQTTVTTCTSLAQLPHTPSCLSKYVIPVVLILPSYLLLPLQTSLWLLLWQDWPP